MPVAMRRMFEQLFDFAHVDPMLEQKMIMDQMMLPLLLIQIQRQSELGYQQMAQAMAGESEKAIREDRISKSETKTSDKKTKSETGEVTEFTIVYYNPELQKVEAIAEETTIETDIYSSPEEQVIEESVGQKSMYSAYSMIAQPVLREKIDPYILQSVLSQIEVHTPGPFGGAAAVEVSGHAFAKLEHRLQAEGLNEHVVAVQALREINVHKEALIRTIGKEILVLEDAIKSLQETDKSEKRIIEKLPPLSRIRYQALLKKKAKVERTLLADLLISDVEFLEAMKKRLKKMGLREFLKIADKLKGFLGK